MLCLSHQEVDVVSQRVIIPAEEGLGVDADLEKPAFDINLVDLLERRLPDVNAQIGHIDAVRRNRPADVIVKLIADDEIVHDVTVECVRLGDQRIVVMVRGSVFDGEQIREVFDALEDVCVGEIPERHLVFGRQLVIDVGRDLGKAVIVRHLVENGASRG